MFAIAGGPSLAGSPLTWSLLFARQPEPDLEFTEEELEQTTTIRSPSPPNPPKKSSGRPLLWVLLLVLIGGGAYVAMEPEMIMDYVGPLLGESPAPPPQPPVARRPAPPKPAPTAQPQAPVSTPPAETPVEAPQAAAPPTAPVPEPPAIQPMPTTPAPIQALPSPAPVAPITTTPTPLFSEGQRVSVLANPTNPGGKVVLTQDAERTRSGPAIPPGTALTILDGDLQGNDWVYSVRSDFGTKGWLMEKQLKLKP